MSDPYGRNHRGREFTWPQPWPGIGAYAATRERRPAPSSGIAAELLEALNATPLSYWGRQLAEHLEREHDLPRARMRYEITQAVRRRDAVVFEDGHVFCAPAIAGGWLPLKQRAWELLGDAGAPVIPTFAAIAEALDCTPPSAQTVTYRLCEENDQTQARYAGHFAVGHHADSAASVD